MPTPAPPDCMPVGTMLLYAADTTKAQTYMTLFQAGWMACDGSPLDVHTHQPLYDAIGTTHGGHAIGGQVVRFNVPDMAARYVRGVDRSAGRDPDKTARTAGGTGGASGNNCGSIQDQATAAPHNAYVTDAGGAHTHVVNNVTTSDHYAYSSAGDTKAHTNSGGNTTTASAGAHTHTLTGGDTETRPTTICLAWIIRYLPPSTTSKGKR